MQDERVVLGLDQEIADNKLDFNDVMGAMAREVDLVNSQNEKKTRIDANSSKKLHTLKSIEECKREKQEKNFELKEMAQVIRDKEAELSKSKQELINMHSSKQQLEMEAQKFQNEMTQLMERMENLDQEKERADETKKELERQQLATEAVLAYQTKVLVKKVKTLGEKRAEFHDVAKEKYEKENQVKRL